MKKEIIGAALGIGIALGTGISDVDALTKITTENLNIRAGASTSYKRIGIIPKGTKVNILDVYNGWYYISYNGKKGYICSDYTANITTPNSVNNNKTINRLVIVNKSNYTVNFYKYGKLTLQYRCAIGKNSTPTPNGKFTIVNKLVNPYYNKENIAGGDPSNPLGKRWLGIGGLYGIHGTPYRNSIGSMASNGCVRMKDEDIINLFKYLYKGDVVLIGSGGSRSIAAYYGYEVK